MENEIKKQFPKTNQKWTQFFAAKYCGKSEECVVALRTLMDALIANKGVKGFVADFTKNYSVILDELKDPNYYEGMDAKINLDEHNLTSTYDAFLGWKKTRVLYVNKVIPTYTAITNTEVVTTVTAGEAKITNKDNVVIPLVDMRKEITSYIDNNNEKYVVYANKKNLFVSEVTNKPYEKIVNVEPSKISVDQKCDAQTLVTFVSNMEAEMKKEPYTEMLKKCVASKQAEIPIPCHREGKVDYVQVVLPTLSKNFMNKDLVVHNQDIAQAIIESKKCDVTDKTEVVLRKEFKVEIEKGVDDRAPTLLFNPSWLEVIPFDAVSIYCPLYTGLQTCPWILELDKEYPPCRNKETFKRIMGLILKIAKIFALATRARMSVVSLQNYIDKVLLIPPKSVYGVAVRKNLKLWASPVVITKYRESALFSVKESIDFFDKDGKADYTDVFEEYIGPDFDGEDEGVMVDRDKVQKKKGQTRDNNKSYKDAIAENEKEREKKKKAKRKKQKKSETSSSASSQKKKSKKKKS